MMYSAFSSVRQVSGLSLKGIVMVPVTALPVGGFRCRVSVIMVITIFMLVRIVDSEQCSGKGCDLAEADEERLVNLSLRFDEDPAVKHDHSPDREDGCRKQLYVDFLFHAAKVI